MTQPPDPNDPSPGPDQQPPAAGQPSPGGQWGAPTQPPPPAPPPGAGYGYGQYPPGAVPPGMYVDPVSGLVIPQGTQLAGIGRRIGAYFLGILLFIVTLVIGYIIWGLVIWSRGQTPALQVLGMRVWRPDTNKPATFWWMALREIVGRFVEGILGGITELISFILMCTSRERRCIHDYVAGTVVLHDPNKAIPA